MMNRLYTPMCNERGSALLVAVAVIPVMTLLCIFASNISIQDQQVTTNDKLHRIAFYNGDGATYGTAKLISLIGKSDTREPVQAGEGEEAPGIQYLNSESDPAEYFRHLLTSMESEKTTEDVAFVKADAANDIGLDANVDLTKMGPGGTPAGGGAEFGSGGEGIGASMSIVVFRLQSKGQSPSTKTQTTIIGDYWLITNKDGRTKGI
jgi:hypothetical protein